MPKQRRFHSHKAARMTTIKRRVGARSVHHRGPTKRRKRLGLGRSPVRSLRRFLGV